MDYRPIKLEKKERTDSADNTFKKPSTENRSLVFIGLVASIGVAIWWYSELRSFLGENVAANGFKCLLSIGTGNCATLWFAGMHQENQIASFIFYAGIIAIICGSTNRDKVLLLCFALALKLIDFSIASDLSSQTRQPTQQAQYHSNVSSPTPALSSNSEALNAVNECKNKHLIGELKTQVDTVSCSNPGIMQAYNKSHYRYMDLIDLLTEKRLDIAEKVDNHIITEAQGDAETSEFLNHLANIQNRRNNGQW